MSAACLTLCILYALLPLVPTATLKIGSFFFFFFNYPCLIDEEMEGREIM